MGEVTVTAVRDVPKIFHHVRKERVPRLYHRGGDETRDATALAPTIMIVARRKAATIRVQHQTDIGSALYAKLYVGRDAKRFLCKTNVSW